MNRPPPQTDPEALIAALAAVAEAAWDGAPSGEPEPEELLDYLEGRLPPADEARVARQLAASPEAARALLDLADLEAAGAAAGTQPAELAARAGWRDLERRLPAAAPRPAPAAVALHPRRRAAGVHLGLERQGVQGLGGAEPSGRQPRRASSWPLVAARPAEQAVPLSSGAPLVLALDPAVHCPATTRRSRARGTATTGHPGLEQDGREPHLALAARPGELQPAAVRLRPGELEEDCFQVTAR